jgi:hypothetical protein
MNRRRWLHVAFLLFWVMLLGLFFAMTEIQIEGANGWACALPTWRIEKHWLLGMPTGYLLFSGIGISLIISSFVVKELRS